MIKFALGLQSLSLPRVLCNNSDLFLEEDSSIIDVPVHKGVGNQLKLMKT
jgi:hypothetical protein